MTRTYAPHLHGDARKAARAKAAELYLAGCTIRSVAIQLGRSYGNTRTLLLEAKVRIRPKGSPERAAV